MADPSSVTTAIPGLKEQVTTDVTPEIPKPGDTVTITAETYSSDSNSSLIVWKVNGVTQLKGIGKKKFAFVMGESGTVTTVDLTISPQGAPDITKTFTFSPADVDILWQAKTYTPPFYKGKALYTPESEVVFVAQPNIITPTGKVDPTNAVYTWKKDYEVDGDNSGFGKNTYDFKGPIILNPVMIQAEVYAAANEGFKGQNGYKLTNVFPVALAYEDDPIYGIFYNRAVRSQYHLGAQEVKFSVSPYFFSTPDKNSLLSYSWNLDNSALDIPTFQNSVIFRRTDSLQGQSQIDVSVSEDSKMLQSSGDSVTVFYDDKK